MVDLWLSTVNLWLSIGYLWFSYSTWPVGMIFHGDVCDTRGEPLRNGFQLPKIGMQQSKQCDL